MIARSEEELEIFKQIDIERKKTETQSRLIEESELPDWLVKNDDEVVCSKVSFLDLVVIQKYLHGLDSSNNESNVMKLVAKGSYILFAKLLV